MMKFRELISRVDFDFDIEKDKEGNPVLFLVDGQKAYLGDIESYRFPIDLEHVMEAVNGAIDRLDIYWNDTLIEGILESADENEREALEELTVYLPDMLDYITKNNVKVDADDMNMLKAICDLFSVDIDEVHKELLKAFPLTREEVQNYLVKQGAYVKYDGNGERYVEDKHIDTLLGCNRISQLAYVIRESIDFFEYETWQALETKLFGEQSEEMPYYVASTINGILWNELSVTSLEFIGKKETEVACNEQNQN